MCHCGMGYKRNLTLFNCDDVDECKIFGTCSQLCKNLHGSYECQCVDKFHLSADNKTCVANSNESSWIYFSTEYGLYKYNVESRYEIRINDNLRDVVAVAADANYVYWTAIEPQKQRVFRMNHSSSSIETIALNGVGSAEGLAVDWWTDNLYYTDSTFNHIAVCGKFGTRCLALITKDLHKPRGIALNPSSAQMFWTDWGKRPHIGVSYMDGAEQDTFVEKDVHWPNGLTIDYPSSRLYWVDAKTGKLESILLNGNDRQLVRSHDTWHPFDVKLLGDRLYWTEKYAHTLNSVDKFTGKKMEVLLTKSKIRALYAYHPSIHRPVNDSENPCHQHHCSHLCLLSKGGGASCACSGQGKIGEEICLESKSKILIGYNNKLYELQYQEVGVPTIEPQKRIAVLGKVNVDRLAYNPANKDIFVADNIEGVIWQVKPSYFMRFTRLVTKDVGKVSSMAVDPVANNLYWTDSDRRTIEMVSMDTKHRTVIHMFHDDIVPYSLVLAPQTGKLFVAVNENPVKIYQMSMSGAGMSNYLRKWKRLGGESVRVAMTIDEQNTVIYLALGPRIVSWNYEQNKELMYRDNLPVNINQLVMVPSIDRFFWTGGDDRIYWDSKSPAVDKSLAISGSTGKPNATPANIPIVQYDMGTAYSINPHHPCSMKNGGCSDICVSHGKSFTCLCGAGRTFKSAENKTCIPQIDCEYKCSNGACLPLSRYCNGKKDCTDGSDEEHCLLSEISANHMICSYDEFKCFDGSECLEISQKCDHHSDCKDQSDEWHCENFNLTTRCHHHQFLCNETTKCVDLMGLCDNYDDCGDNSDEQVCELPKAQRPSCGDLYDCGNGQCIDKAWICDGEGDCSNGDDEATCRYSERSCPGGYFECRDHTCIHMELVCDGHQDCAGGLDEFSCKNVHPAVPKDCEFQCLSNRSMCLPRSKVCDGFTDCPRGEDERNCSMCLPSQFQCGSANASIYNVKFCIEKEFVCDKEKDCLDGSDEANCDHSLVDLHYSAIDHVHCNKDMFHCGSGECIEMFRVCDHNHDCTDGSDEGGRCESACDGHSCRHECQALPTGPKCSCAEGFELRSNDKSCEDINECLDSPCAQMCENTWGSFQCSCFPNFMLHHNKRSCKAMGAQRYLLYTSHSQVRKMSSYPMLTEVFWTAPMDAEVFGMALDIPRHHMYVSSLQLSEIYQIDLRNGTVRTVEADRPEKMAVDWGSGNIYIADNSGVDGGRVRVCSFESKRCVTIVSLRKFDYIDHLEVDAREQLLFYSQESVYHGVQSDKMLYSVRLDGTRRKIVYPRLPFSSFTLDVNKRAIYFADLALGKIWEINYGGTQERSVASGLKDLMAPRITAMAVFQGYVMVALSGKPFYVSCALFKKQNNCFTTQLDVANVNHFRVVQDTIQPKVDNVCKDHRCHRMCIPTSRGPKCLCNNGVQVQAGEECPYTEGDLAGDLVDVSQNEISSAMMGTDVEPSVAGRVILALLFILSGIAGITFFVYRRRYLMSTFTIT